MTAITLYLRPNKRLFVEVLALFFVLIDPQFGVHLCYLLRHKTTEYSIAGVLCCCWKYAHVKVLFDLEHVTNLFRQDAPLVKSEVINDDEEYFLAFVNEWEHLFLEDLWA